MISEAGALAECFVGTALAGREVTTYEMAESGDLLFGVDIEQAEELAVWSAARALVDRTGRWPAVGGDIYPRPSIDVSTVDICSDQSDRMTTGDWGLIGEGVCAELRAAQEQAWPPSPLEDRLHFQLSRTRAHYGSAPEPIEVLDRFARDVSNTELERWLLEWEEQQQPTTGSVDSGHIRWFFDEDASLIFYPTPFGPCSIAYEPFYGEGDMPGMTTERLITILEAWRRTYGAELVANHGTILQFVVALPPKNIEDAWKLALQQALVAQHTVAGPPVTLREHARTLIQRPTWFLHQRP
jgi:hypothetical protein